MKGSHVNIKHLYEAYIIIFKPISIECQELVYKVEIICYTIELEIRYFH